jgi:hypothetical protein
MRFSSSIFLSLAALTTAIGACAGRADSTPGGCDVAGHTYAEGESWTVPSPECPAAAGTCVCTNGHAACSAPTIACVNDAGPPVRCGSHAVGDTWQVPTCPGRADLFDTCACKSDGTVECSGPAIACVDGGLD